MTAQLEGKALSTPAPPKEHSSRVPYSPALDGVRALAVIAVLIYHAGLDWLPGGFLGVEIFFTISGYLITSLLLAEWRQTNRIVLKNFWLRRARRLLPALFFIVIASLAFAVLFLPEEVTKLRADALAAFGYSTNWYLIFSRQSYFETVGRPSLLRHLWSLAVEEQFYVLWPLIFVFTMRRWRPRSVLMGVLATVAASVALMALLYVPGADPSRVYYGTDTRASGILIGVALAYVWAPGRAQGRWVDKLPFDLIGLAALGALVACCLRINEFDDFLYRGGFPVTALSTAVLIAAVVHPRGRRIAAVLGSPPLVWLGLRSYGVYLWHWPVFMLTRPQLDVSLDGLALLGLRFGLTLALSVLSYRFLETPIRSGALGRSWTALKQAQGAQRRRLTLHWAGAMSALIIVFAVLGSSVVRAQPPQTPEYLAAMAMQIDSNGGPTATAAPTETAAPTIAPTATPIPEPSVTPLPEATATAMPETDDEPAVAEASAEPEAVSEREVTATPTSASPSPTEEGDAGIAVRIKPKPFVSVLPTPTRGPTPARTPIVTEHITAIGDSVMLGAAPGLQQAFTDIDVNAEKGRQVYNEGTAAIIGLLNELRAANKLGPFVVLHLGNNGSYTEQNFNLLMSALSDQKEVIVLTVRAPRNYETYNNRVIMDGVQRFPNAVLIDWKGITAKRPELFWDDGMHLRPEGALFYANLIANAIPRK